MQRFFFTLLLFLHTGFCRADFYDCFTFFNELELLEVRLEELYDVVDHFVLVEATKTFSGKPKPLYFLENQEKFQKYRDKIIHVIVDDFPFPDDNSEFTNWPREFYQRDAILRGLVGCKNDDIIMVSDADEIANVHAISEIKHFFSELQKPSKKKREKLRHLICELHMRFFLLYLNLEDCTGWNGAAKATFYEVIKTLGPNNMRLLHNTERTLPRIFDAGWHFHAMGDKERVAAKLRSVSTAYMEVDDEGSYDRWVKWIKANYRLKISPIDGSFPKGILNRLDWFQAQGWFTTQSEFGL